VLSLAQRDCSVPFDISLRPAGRQTIIFRQVLGEFNFHACKRFVLLDIGRRALEGNSAAATTPLLGL
jgi:hypothetical protein